MNKYGGIFIFRPNLAEKDIESEYAKVEEVIKKHEGKIGKSEKWGKKRLTFAIKKFQDGFFLYVAFEAPPQSIKALTELFKLDANILRAQLAREK